jgi:hypothetical protein
MHAQRAGLARDVARSRKASNLTLVHAHGTHTPNPAHDTLAVGQSNVRVCVVSRGAGETPIEAAGVLS